MGLWSCCEMTRFVCFEYGLQSVECEMLLVPKAYYNAGVPMCACVRLNKWACLRTVHVDCMYRCLWHTAALLICLCLFCFFLLLFIFVCALVVSGMNKWMDTVPWALLYYFWFIVQHKQVWQLDSISLGSCRPYLMSKWKQLHTSFSRRSACLYFLLAK